MSNIFTLDSMREEIEREFAPLKVDLGDVQVTLRNLLRLPKTEREEVYGLLDELSAEDAEEESGLRATERSARVALKVIPLVADSPAAGRKLVSLIEEDLALTLRVFSKWMEGTQAGEAESLDS